LEPTNFGADIYGSTSDKLFRILFTLAKALLVKIYVLQKAVHAKRSALEVRLHRGEDADIINTM
jgi:hypothetical protein